MTADSILSHLFPPFALESQILPNGLYVVDSITSPSPPSLQRPPIKRLPFSSARALSNPRLYALPSKAEGYAKLTLNITRGVAEMYRREQDFATQETHEAANIFEGKSPCCAGKSPSPGTLDGPIIGSTPPFFPQFRVYLNDKPVYQTRVICLQKSEDTDDATAPEFQPSSPSSLMDSNSQLMDVYDLEWNESSTYWIYSPATILTFQLIELDFCPDLKSSEDVLTSVSIPLAPLLLNKPLDLLLNVQCTLPHAYSLESLVSEADRLSKAANQTEGPSSPPAPLQLHLCPPTSVICKVHVSLTLEQTRRLQHKSLAELAALSLPRGPWTPGVLVDEVQAKDQLTLLCGTELLSSRTPTIISLSYVLSQVGSLIFSLTIGFDAIGADQVVTLLGHNTLHYSLEDRKRLTYVAAGEDLAVILEYLVVNPLRETTNLINSILTFRRPALTCLVICVLWLPILLPSRYMIPYAFLLLLIAYDLVFNLHIPRRSGKRNELSIKDFLKAFGKIQGAKMLTNPLEVALARPSMIRRVRLTEVWIRSFRERLTSHEMTSTPPGAWHFVWNFIVDPTKIGILFILAFSEHSRRVASIGFAILATMIMCREVPLVRTFISAFRGFPRLLKLRGLRRNHVSAATSYTPLSQRQ